MYLQRDIQAIDQVLHFELLNMYLQRDIQAIDQVLHLSY